MLQHSKVTGTFVIEIEKEITFDDRLINENQAKDNMVFACKKALEQILVDNQMIAKVKAFKEV